MGEVHPWAFSLIAADLALPPAAFDSALVHLALVGAGGQKFHHTTSVSRPFVFRPAAWLGTSKGCRVQPASASS